MCGLLCWEVCVTDFAYFFPYFFILFHIDDNDNCNEDTNKEEESYYRGERAGSFITPDRIILTRFTQFSNFFLLTPRSSSKEWTFFINKQIKVSNRMK